MYVGFVVSFVFIVVSSCLCCLCLVLWFICIASVLLVMLFCLVVYGCYLFGYAVVFPVLLICLRGDCVCWCTVGVLVGFDLLIVVLVV